MSDMFKNFAQMMNNSNVSSNNIGNTQANYNQNNNFNHCNNSMNNCYNNSSRNSYTYRTINRKGKNSYTSNSVRNNRVNTQNTVNVDGFNDNSFSNNSSPETNINNINDNEENRYNSTQNNEFTGFSDFNNIFGNIDINTIFKMQQIMSSLNDKENDSRTNLLMSLKPYLKESRKNKVDQYIQLMKMEKVFEIMNPLGGEKKNV